MVIFAVLEAFPIVNALTPLMLELFVKGKVRLLLKLASYGSTLRAPVVLKIIPVDNARSKLDKDIIMFPVAVQLLSLGDPI